MNVFDDQELFSGYCRLAKKFGLLLSIPNWLFDDDSFHGDFYVEVFKAAPYLEEVFNDQHGMQAVMDGKVYLVFDTEEEMQRHYNLTVGDDGPTETNPYDGPISIYALCCGPDGEFLNENT